MDYRGFELSDFQVDAIEGVKNNENVIVSTYTGNGKTLIADYAVDMCLKEGKKVVYTAPIKALTNQKFTQFKNEHGEENVGLITGDRVINDTAPIPGVTTEILRNMMHEDPQRVENIKYIILDELHYLNDEERGTVWEECIIFKGKNTRIIGLSATIPNIDEICDWIEYVHGEKVRRVFYPHRIIPQKHSYFDKRLGPCNKKDIMRHHYSDENFSKKQTTHVDFINYARQQDLLPVLTFVFSRKQCEEKAFELAGLNNFTDMEERLQIEEIFLRKEQEYPILKDKHSWKDIKSIVGNGICYHHAGLLPIIKEVVEELFERKLVKVLYATETFSVGINYPVRTVLFDSLRKFDGKNFRTLTGSEYLQMSGRAGRRGIDDFGNVFSLVDYRHLTQDGIIDLDKVKSDRVESQFKLSYNTVLNLASRYTREEISEFMKKSLASFQYINSLNRKYAELAGQKEELKRLTSKGGIKNSCKSFNAETCPVMQGMLREELRSLINVTKKRDIDDIDRQASNERKHEVEKALKVKPKKCSKGLSRKCKEDLKPILELKRSIKKVEKSLSKSSNTSPDVRFNKEYEEKLAMLKQFGYIDENNVLMPRGKTCSKIHVQELFVTEMIYEGLFHDLDENSLNAYAAGIVFEDDRPMHIGFKQSFDFTKVHKILETITKKEEKFEIKNNTTFIETICPVMYHWSNGCSLEEITNNTELLEGDFVALCRRVIDLYRQIKNAYQDDKIIVAKINSCIDKINRDVVELGL